MKTKKKFKNRTNKGKLLYIRKISKIVIIYLALILMIAIAYLALTYIRVFLAIAVINFLK